ncbi:MAG: hypothetical protein AB7F66_04680 [Bacteriovoracia bacterium]
MKNSCQFCGSAETEILSVEKEGALPDNTAFKYHAQVLRCSNCQLKVPVKQSSDAEYDQAYVQAQAESVEKISERLSEVGLTMASIERSFGIPQRTIMRWKSKGCSAAGFSLMHLLNVYPWLTKIADHNYDPRFASKEVLRQAAEIYNGPSSIEVAEHQLLGSPSISLNERHLRLVPKSNSSEDPQIYQVGSG